ncbi:MAG TPA: urate hydroxylase PuuD [Bdellovibrionota bacterium]|jgi:uncharacterized membrane protein|nr:urate hydroxylase PuuD [Bdellovibrionota bacterium]
MDWFAGDWLGLAVRWAHLIAGISWIGSSFYFMWLDANLEVPGPGGPKDVEGSLWMVHSGGFYEVVRKRIGPGSMPKTLHWFKYEALFTWITGTFLLGLVYYAHADAYLSRPGSAPLTGAQAVAWGVGLMVGSWAVYDTLWATLGKKVPGVVTAVSVALAVGLAFGLCQVFGGRGAFIHLGAIFGTIMVANVWMRILPAQQRMIDATARGETPDFGNSAAAKRRSVHNSYMTFPVIFMMLSNHYPAFYGRGDGSLVLVTLVALGMAMRHAMIAKSAGVRKIAGAVGTAVLAGLIVMLQPQAAPASITVVSGPPVTFAQAREVIQTRCVACHSEHPTDTTFTVAPNGVTFTSAEHIKAFVERIRFRAVETKTMPLANKTGMTEEERAILARWIQEGAPI